MRGSRVQVNDLVVVVEVVRPDVGDRGQVILLEEGQVAERGRLVVEEILLLLGILGRDRGIPGARRGVVVQVDDRGRGRDLRKKKKRSET